MSAKGGIPIQVMRMMPMARAHTKAYQGPSMTAQVTLIKCAMGHIPSTRRMGEMTTPRAVIMARKTSFAACLFLFIDSFLFSAAGNAGREHFRVQKNAPACVKSMFPEYRHSDGNFQTAVIGRRICALRSMLDCILSIRNTDSHRYPFVRSIRALPLTPAQHPKKETDTKVLNVL